MLSRKEHHGRSDSAPHLSVGEMLSEENKAAVWGRGEKSGRGFPPHLFGSTIHQIESTMGGKSGDCTYPSRKRKVVTGQGKKKRKRLKEKSCRTLFCSGSKGGQSIRAS